MHRQMLLDTFVSGVFTSSKNDGSKRMILNLKRLNKCLGQRHFKMESIQNVLELITPGAAWHPLISKMPFIQYLFTKTTMPTCLFM